MLNEAILWGVGARSDRPTCREVAALLAAYLEEELAPGVRGRVEDHLERCADCLVYLAGYRMTIRLLRATSSGGDPAVPEPLVRAILRGSNADGRAVATPRSAGAGRAPRSAAT